MSLLTTVPVPSEVLNIQALPEDEALFRDALKTQKAVDQLFTSLSVPSCWSETHRVWTKDLIRWVGAEQSHWGMLVKVLIAAQGNPVFRELFLEVLQEDGQANRPFLAEALLQLIQNDSTYLQSSAALLDAILHNWVQQSPDSPQFLAILAICLEQGFFGENSSRFTDLLTVVLKSDAAAPFELLHKSKYFHPTNYEQLISAAAIRCLRYLVINRVDLTAEGKLVSRAASALVRITDDRSWYGYAAEAETRAKTQRATDFLDLLLCARIELPPISRYKDAETKLIDEHRLFFKLAQALHTQNDRAALKEIILGNWELFAKWLSISPLASTWMSEHRTLVPDLCLQLGTQYGFRRVIADALVQWGGFQPKEEGVSFLLTMLKVNSPQISQIADWLLPHQLDLNQIDPETKQRPLELLCLHRNFDLIPNFLAGGANPNLPFTDGSTLLENVLQAHQQRMQKEAKQSYSGDSSRDRIEQETLSAIEALAHYDFDFQGHKPINLIPFISSSFLLLLIQNGVDLCTKNGENDDTLLHLLIKEPSDKNLLAIEAILCHHQAEAMQALSSREGTPLTLALKSNQLMVVALLLHAGSRVDSIAQPQFTDPNIGVLLDLYGDRAVSSFTLKQFANLLGDDFIRNMKSADGAPLEGVNFTESLAHLAYSLQTIADGDAQILEAAGKLAQAVLFSRWMTHILITNRQKRVTPLEKVLLRVFAQHLRALKVGEKTVLPWGWVDEKAGHAMLAMFEKTAQGLTVTVINTSSANHDYYDLYLSGTKVLIRPLIQYQGVSLEELIETDFFAAFTAVQTQLPLAAYEEYKLKDLCGAILQRIEQKRVDVPNQDLVGFVQTQSAGTCAYRAPLAFVHLELGKAKYKQVKHKLHLFNAQQALQLPVDPVQREILARTAQNLARQTRKLLHSAAPFGQAKHSLAIIRKLHMGVLTTTLSVSSPKPLTLEYAKTDGKRQAAFVNSRPLLPSAEGAAASGQAQSLMPIHPSFAGDPLDFLQQLNLWVAKANRVNKTVLIEAILSLPLPTAGIIKLEAPFNDVWGLMGPAAISVCLDQLKQLQAHLVKDFDLSLLLAFDHVLSFHHAAAIFWRLSCQLDRYGADVPFSLNYYGISDAPLQALKEHIHLLPYSPTREQKLSRLMEFYRQSHPQYGNPARTLFAFDTFSEESGGYISFPFPETSGEMVFLKSQQISEEVWGYAGIDQALDREIKHIGLSLHDRPDKYLWRLASLYEKDPFAHQKANSAPFYSLRDFVLQSWLATKKELLYTPKLSLKKLHPYKPPQILVKVVDSYSYGVSSRFKTIATPTAPYGITSHLSLGGNVDQIYPRFFEDKQNEFLIGSSRNFRNYFDLTREKVLSLSRLVQFFKELPGFSLDAQHRVFFHLVLFGQGKLSEELELAGPILHLLERELEEISLQLTKNLQAPRVKGIEDGSARKEQEGKLLSAYLSMALCIFRVCDYHNLGSSKARLQKTLRKWLAEKPYEVLHNPAQQANLAFTLMASQPPWEEFFACRQVAQSRLQVEKYVFDPSLVQQIDRLIYENFPVLVELYKDRDRVKRTLQAILPLDEDMIVSGSFPVFEVTGKEMYRVDLVEGLTWINGSLQHEPIPFYSTSQYIEVFGDKRFKNLTITNLSGGSKLYLAPGEVLFIWNPISLQLRIDRYIEKGWYHLVPTSSELVQGLFTPSVPLEKLRTWQGKFKFLLEEVETGRKTFINKKGEIFRPDSSDTWVCLNAEEVTGSAGLSHFSESINFWQTGNRQEIEFPLYCDEDGDLIVFEKRREQWVWKKYPNLSIHPFQNPEVNHLILTDRSGNKSAFIPVKALSVAPQFACKCEWVDLQQPKEIGQKMLLAYQALGKKEYFRAWELLKKSESSNLYSAEEQRLLAWIFLQGNETSDYSPEALAIRLYTAWLIHENLRRYPQGSPVTVDSAVAPLHLYSAPEEWVLFWQGKKKWQEQTAFDLIATDFFDCLSRSGNLPTTLRWMTEEHTLYPFERRDWLQSLAQKVNDFRFTSLLDDFLAAPTSSQLKIELRETSDILQRSTGRVGEKLETILLQQKRLRPEGLLGSAFFPLYAIAKEGNQQEKTQLLQFLTDLSEHPDPNVQALRLLLEATALEKATPIMQQMVEEIRNNTCGVNWKTDLEQEIKGYLNTKKRRMAKGKIGMNQPAPLALPPLPSKPATLIQSHCTPISFPNYLHLLFEYKPRVLKHTPYPELPNALQANSFYQKRHAHIIADWKVGCQKNDENNAWRAKPNGDYAEVQKQLDTLKVEETRLKEQVELLAQQIDGDEQKQLEATLDSLGLVTNPLDLSETLALFTQRDIQQYRKRLPYLSEANCLKLHETIGNWLIHATAVQRLTRALAAPEKADEFLSMNVYNPNELPQLLVFEYLTNWSLRKEQCLNLAKQSDFQDRIMQMIPGFGKTEVNDPIQALMKADGYHLSCLIPIASLVDSQSQNIAERSAAISGKKTHLLRYGRGAQFFNLVYLQWMRATLHRAIIEREYLIMPPETLQAMQNTYIEYRERVQAGIQTTADDLCGQELKTILALIRRRGVATLDEVDEIFSPHMELNFPGLEKEPVDLDSCEMLTELFWVASTDAEIRQLGLNLLGNEQSRLLERDYEKIKPILVSKVIEAIASKERFADTPLRESKAYLLEEKAPLPPQLVELYQLNPKAVERIILLKKLFHSWLAKAWEKSVDEHYGRSQLDLTIEIAKPNLAASTPNERAEFADRWETVIKTIHLYFVTGIDVRQTKKFVAQLTEKARKERLEQDLTSLLETETGQFFGKAVKTYDNQPLDLSTIDLSNEGVVKAIQSQLNNKSAQSLRLIIAYLLESVFVNLKTPTEQIFNHAQSFGSMFAIRQGHSGTIENPYIFPLEFEPGQNIELDPGAAGRVYDRLLSENQNVKTVPLKTNSPLELFSKLEVSPDVHALIDIGAHFKGRLNLQVARELNDFFALNNQSPIQGILFYDDKTNTLNFLKRGQLHPKPIPNSEEETIESMTGLNKEQLFVYFDHRHRVGANFKLPATAHAIGTLGEKTCSRDLVQGAMRMRGLMDAQRIDFVISQGMEPLMRERTGNRDQLLQIQDVILFAEINSLKDEPDENLKAALIKMGDAASRFVLDLLYQENDPVKETELYAKARVLFMRNMSDCLFEKYAQLPVELAAKDYLQNFCQRLEALLQQLKPYGAIEPAVARLRQIAQHAEPFLAPLISSDTTSELSMDSTVENRQEEAVQDELLSQQLQEVQQNSLTADQYLPAHQEKDWDFSEPAKTLERLEGMPSIREVYKKIPLLAPFMHLFSADIALTPNFMHTQKDALNLFDLFQKTAHEVVVYQRAPQEKIRLLFLANREAAQFKQALKQTPGAFPFPISFLTAEGTPSVHGPQPILLQQAESLLMQYLFISGKTHTITKEPWKAALLTWLMVDRDSKRDFYTHISCTEDSLATFKGSALEKIFDQHTSPQSLIGSQLRSLGMASQRKRFRSALQYLNELQKQLPKFTPEQLGQFVHAADLIGEKGEPFIQAAIPLLDQLSEADLEKIGLPPGMETKNIQLMDLLVNLILRKFSATARLQAAKKLCSNMQMISDKALRYAKIRSVIALLASIPAVDLTEIQGIFVRNFRMGAQGIEEAVELLVTLENEKNPAVDIYVKCISSFIKAVLTDSYAGYSSFAIFRWQPTVDLDKLAQIKQWIFAHPRLVPLGNQYFIDTALTHIYDVVAVGSQLVANENKPGVFAGKVLKALYHSQIPYGVARAAELASRLKIDLNSK